MTTTYHEQYPADQAAMQVMRGEIQLHPALEFTPQLRPIFDALLENTPAAKDVSYEAAMVGGVQGWWCIPADALEGAAILYLHGGAYIVGSATASRNLAGNIAMRARTATFTTHYRLAPEHPFPAAFEDVYATYRGLAISGFSRLALVGESTGGGLVLSLLSRVMVAVKDDALLKPVAAAVMSPWTDLALSGDSMETRAAADPLLTRRTLASAVKTYMGEHDACDPRASPLYSDLRGFPPISLHVGEDEILLDDSRRFAESLHASGGIADLHVWRGMTHVFASNFVSLQAAREALDDIGQFLKEHLG